MLIGPIMIAVGVGMAIPTAIDISKTVVDFVKAKKTSKAPVKLSVTEQYTRFFENLDLMDSKKGDWIKCLGLEEQDFYTKVPFILSDSLSITDFQKQCENIRQKLKVVNLEIYEEKGQMVFRSRIPEMPNIPYEYVKTNKHLVPLGINLEQDPILWDMKLDPHLMLIGTSNSGKSTMQNTIINHLIRNIPKTKLYLIDLKKGLEFGIYKNVQSVVSYADSLQDAKKVIADFEAEADARYEELAKTGYRNFYKYVSDKPNTSMKHAFLIIDEFADLMSLNGGKDDYDAIEALVELSRKCRAVGMHLILASQRAVADSIPPNLKANVSAVLGMKTVSEHNSRLIIEENGLEKLKIGECIGILGSEKKFFKGFLIEDEVIEATVKEFSKDKQEEKANVVEIFK
ncbi:MAG: FtsK/SpoIIIE domain-containing protein [Cellulosilyticaceae bacterium]